MTFKFQQIMIFLVSALFTSVHVAAFITPRQSTPSIFNNRNGVLAIPSWSQTSILHRLPTCHGIGTSSQLFMAQDEEGPGLLASIGIGLIMILFVGSGLLPLLDGGGRDLSIADSVVTRQDSSQKLQNFESKQDRLSRATIQEKLSSLPVFYISENGVMKTDIYLSYEDAQEVSSRISGSAVKATTLDQVMYPLVFQRGRMRMAPPPVEVEKAEEELNSEAGVKKSYRLVPSKSAADQAKDFNMDLRNSDIPLFVADRLAFASPKGPQLPLFVDKSDCVYSYQRLRDGKKSLPEQPNIRTTSLLDELDSMEKGTRPGVSQLAFYGTAQDLTKASELSQ